jgi:hypothetical protein
MILPVAIIAAIMIAQAECPQATPKPGPAASASTFRAFARPERFEKFDVQIYEDTSKMRSRAGRSVRSRVEWEEQNPEMKEAMRQAQKQIEKLGNARKYLLDPSIAPVFMEAFKFDVGGPEPRLTLEIDNLPLRDALQKVFKSTKFEFSFEDDISREVRVTLKAPNVRLSTALDMIADAGNVYWTREMRIGSQDAAPRFHYRIVKAKQSDHMAFLRPNTPGSPPSVIQIGPGNKHLGTGTSIQGLVNIVMPQERLTVTCPHCGDKVVTYRSKSTTSSATGSKRTAPLKKWKYCPLCGKPVDYKH